MKFFLCICFFLCGLSPAFAAPETAAREAELDARLGIDRTFPQVNLTALRTRDQLRAAARVRTGLPAYDQQVEGASTAPAALLVDLQRPATAPTAPRRRTSSAPAPDPSLTPQTPDPNQTSPNNPPGSFVAP